MAYSVVHVAEQVGGLSCLRPEVDRGELREHLCDVTTDTSADGDDEEGW